MKTKRCFPLLAGISLAVLMTPNLSAQMNYPGQPPQRPGPSVMCES